METRPDMKDSIQFQEPETAPCHESACCPDVRIAGKDAMRILHVVGAMDPGGTETWLMHVLRRIDRARFRMHFLVHSDRPGAYDHEVTSLGSKVLYCPVPSNLLRYAFNFWRIVQAHGPFDVVHSHVHHFSGWVLALAKAEGIPLRIAHSHSDTSLCDFGCRVPRALYLRTSKWLIGRFASWKLAASRRAAASLFGAEWSGDTRASLLYCGVDFAPFQAEVDKAKVRAELGIPQDAFVIGHVGRFAEPKNHDLLLRIHRELLNRNPRAILLMIGKGPLESKMRVLAEELGVTKSTVFAGTRTDVPRLMLGTMDAFAFPSLYEGLGLAVIEAQAAGLPTVMSDRLPPEADAGCGLTLPMSLSKSPGAWAEAICRHAEAKKTLQKQALDHLRSSVFDIRTSARELCEFYARSLPNP